MAFLAALSGGSGGGINPSSSQSAAIQTGDFGGGTRDFGVVNLGSGSASTGASTKTALYIISAVAVLALAASFLRK